MPKGCPRCILVYFFEEWEDQVFFIFNLKFVAWSWNLNKTLILKCNVKINCDKTFTDLIRGSKNVP